MFVAFETFNKDSFVLVTPNGVSNFDRSKLSLLSCIEKKVQISPHLTKKNQLALSNPKKILLRTSEVSLV